MTDSLKAIYNNLFSDKRFSEILTGSAWALSARVLATGFGLIASIIIARFYGADVVGIVAMINSYMILVTILTVLGTNTSILRIIPEHMVKYSPTSAFRIYKKTQCLVLVASLITSIIFYYYSNLIANKLFSKPHLTFYLSLASVFVVFKSLMLLNTQAIRGLRLVRTFAVMLILPQGTNLIILLLAGTIVKAQDVPVYSLLGSYFLTGILGWLILDLAFKKKMGTKDIVYTVPSSRILSMSFPMLITTAMNFIIGQTGIIMLGMFRNESDVGYYAIAVKMATLTVFVLNAVNSVAGPKFSELFHSGRIDELFYVAKKSTKLIFWITVPILLVLAVFGETLICLVFGAEFRVAYAALLILVLGQFVNSISGSTGLFMNMTGNQKIFRDIMFLATLINIGLNYFLIPEFGGRGAAVAAMISIIFWNIVTLMYIKRKFGKTTGYFPRILCF